jgi:hypothetical protein
MHWLCLRTSSCNTPLYHIISLEIGARFPRVGLMMFVRIEVAARLRNRLRLGEFFHQSHRYTITWFRKGSDVE